MKKDYFQAIKKKVEEAEEYKKRYFKDRAERNVAWYSGYFNTEWSKDKDKIPNNANLTYSTTRTIVASIYAKNPSFQLLIMRDMSDFFDNLKLQGISLSKQAVQTAFEYGLKLMIYDMGLHRTNRIIITDAVVQGFGCTKMGYKYEVDKAKALEVQQSASSFEANDLVKNNKPFILRVNPQNIILPIEACDPKRAEWVCEKIYITKETADKMYNADLPADYSPTYTGEHDKNTMVCVYELHDFKNNKIITYSKNQILDEKPYPCIDEDGNAKSLYQWLWFNDSLSEIVYPVADIDLVMTQIQEANAQIERRINFNRKNTPMTYLIGTWDDMAVNAIKKGEDITVLQNETGDGKITHIPVQSMGQEFYANINALKGEIYEILGLTDYQIGGNTQKRKATEAQLMDRSRLDRVGERVRIIEEFFFEQVDTLVELIKAYQDVPRISKIEYEGNVLELSLDKELYDTADMDIVVVPGSTIAIDQYEQDALLMQDIQMASLAPGFINAGELLRQYYQKRGYTNIEKIIPTEQQFQADFAQLPGTQGQPGVPSTTPLEQGKLPNTGSVEGLK